MSPKCEREQKQPVEARSGPSIQLSKLSMQAQEAIKTAREKDDEIAMLRAQVEQMAQQLRAKDYCHDMQSK